MSNVNLRPYEDLATRLKNAFSAEKTRSLSYRREQLQNLENFLIACEAEIAEATFQDLRKPVFETYVTEIGFVKTEIRYALKHLANWTAIAQVNTPLIYAPGKSQIIPEPKGVVLILGPFNYPIQLVLLPLVSAIAAGNCAVIKPSELAPACSSLLKRRLGAFLDPSCFDVVEGGPETSEALLREPFDHIFFTGSAETGKKVMSAAANHLTPVTLELGGKTPCIVDRNVDIELAAKRIAWGKFLNAGQTCIAPDYVMVHEKTFVKFLDALKTAILELYGDDPKQSKDFARIATIRRVRELAELCAHGRLVTGGQYDEADRYFAPTVVTDVDPHSPLMQQEIFGPILPVLTTPSLDHAIAFISARQKPLALYVFTNDKTYQDAFVYKTSSGGICINDTLSHVGVPELPFGGVGQSGFGSYHGKAGFDTFSHYKPVYRRSTLVDVPLRYPPYKDNQLSIAKWFM
jgi:acyl-CoA reductase-like NAD-dependent aldehyde dehydrogenase